MNGGKLGKKHFCLVQKMNKPLILFWWVGMGKIKPNQENLKPENNVVIGNSIVLSIIAVIVNSLYFPIK